MKLAKHDIPLGAGCKGNRVPKKKVSRTKSRVFTDENRLPLHLDTVSEIHGDVQSIGSIKKSAHMPLTNTQYNINVEGNSQTISPPTIVHHQQGPPSVAVKVSPFTPSTPPFFRYNVPYFQPPPYPIRSTTVWAVPFTLHITLSRSSMSPCTFSRGICQITIFVVF